ncbi:MAG: SRPBCC family protein [Planctomycetota bacterium]
MPSIELVHHAPGPVDQVFEVYSDISKAAERVEAIREIEMLTPGPVGEGTRFRETRVVFKREASEEMELVEFEPNRAYTIACFSCGAEYRTRYDFEPDGEGTRVTVRMNITPKSLFAKLLSPLSFFMTNTMKKCLEDDMIALDRVVSESEARTASA